MARTSPARPALRLLGASAALAAIGAAHAADEAPLPPFPHPAITEVLFAVPPGPDGDANGDGERTPTGDEFVELVNLHDRPIDLAGYTITDRNEEPSRQIRFTFPACALAPGQVAVVFNGAESSIPGPVGDETAAAGPNPYFRGALVFTMKIAGRNKAFSNQADYVLLAAPDGAPVEAVHWGDPQPAPPATTLRSASVPAGVSCSVQRRTAESPFEAHRNIDNQLFSPGALPESASASP